jgi:vitellogenic carboxypeptidase-like protein
LSPTGQVTNNSVPLTKYKASLAKMIIKILLISSIFLINSSFAKLFINPYPSFETHSGDNSEVDGDDVLYITPLLESGKKVEDIQKMAAVTLDELKPYPSYSGFFTVNKTYNSNMFFWYFPAQNDAANAPVLLWLQGELDLWFLGGL